MIFRSTFEAAAAREEILNGPSYIGRENAGRDAIRDLQVLLAAHDYLIENDRDYALSHAPAGQHSCPNSDWVQEVNSRFEIRQIADVISRQSTLEAAL